MVKAVFVICALVILQGVWCKPKGKAVQQAPEKSTLDELTANAQQIINNVTETLGIKDLTDSKKVVEALNKNAQILANQLNSVVDKLKTEMTAHKPEVDNVIKQAEEKFTETAKKLQELAGPEAAAKAKELKTNLDNGLKTAVDQIEKLRKAVEPDATKVTNDIQTAAKNLLDQVVQIGTDLNEQIKKDLAEHEKTHKH